MQKQWETTISRVQMRCYCRLGYTLLLLVMGLKCWPIALLMHLRHAWLALEVSYMQHWLQRKRPLFIC